MLHFESDYTTGMHPEILRKLFETNLISESGYGSDQFSLSARKKISELCGVSIDDVCLLSGGTQTNEIVIDALLSDFEGVISADTGHIACHEAGSIEYSGHKVITIKSKNGIIDFDEFYEYLKLFHADENREHMVYPGMVYISYPTEYGTLYAKKDLMKLRGFCNDFSMKLFIDGARLGYGLMSEDCDLTIKELSDLADCLYIGGTKVGAMIGEAVVFTKNNKPRHFTNFIKRRGALLAKGRLLGIQFDTLFTDNLYFDISKHAIEMSKELIKVLESKNIQFYLKTPTNQQFVVLDNFRMDELKETVRFEYWGRYDDTHTIVRFCTSWSTTMDDIKALREVL